VRAAVRREIPRVHLVPHPRVRLPGPVDIPVRDSRKAKFLMHNKRASAGGRLVQLTQGNVKYLTRRRDERKI